MESFDWTNRMKVLDRRLLVLETLFLTAADLPDGALPVSGSSATAFYYGLAEFVRDIRGELREVAAASGDCRTKADSPGENAASFTEAR